eukprot:GHVS01089222.1.p1 GENE.GHVS01089222.1~~GHVS01089222.1.p1  ORF type:complete len:283 (-),score=72.63 GHVS01089222.1:290-1138(-)
MSTTRDEFIYTAKLAEQAERYDEMADAMNELAGKGLKAGEELTVEERNLLSVAYKNAVGARRASWRIISSVEQKEQSKGNEMHATVASTYREKVEEELNKICGDILNLLSDKLIPNTTDNESIVFYYKMKGDYYRYISEFSSEDKRKKAGEDAELAYRKASEVAEAELPSTHPIRLGLALNYSVFYYEILSEPHHACQMAKRAFDDAITEFEHVSEECYKDSTLIMQLLRDNLTLWTSDLQQTEQPATTAVPAGGTEEEDGGKRKDIEDASPAPLDEGVTAK